MFCLLIRANVRKIIDKSIPPLLFSPKVFHWKKAYAFLLFTIHIFFQFYIEHYTCFSISKIIPVYSLVLPYHNHKALIISIIYAFCITNFAILINNFVVYLYLIPFITIIQYNTKLYTSWVLLQ